MVVASTPKTALPKTFFEHNIDLLKCKKVFKKKNANTYKSVNEIAYRGFHSLPWYQCHLSSTFHQNIVYVLIAYLIFL
jgi:hypothetical protein